LIFSFYQFNAPPLSFNSKLVEEAKSSGYKEQVLDLQSRYDSVNALKQERVGQFIAAEKNGSKDSSLHFSDQLKNLNTQTENYRVQFKNISSKVSSRDTNDTNYVFLAFVKEYLPTGLKGLLIAIIFLAAWGSIAAALNSLSASTVVDFHQRWAGNDKPLNEYRLSKWYTVGWGVFCIIVAQFANQIGQSLIETVNILGSLFYGVILGIFLVAFYLKWVKARSVFWAAVIVESYIIISAIWPWLLGKMPFITKLIPASINKFMNSASEIGFLWLNVIGAMGVVLLALLIQTFNYKKKPGML
jgi:Na+/proline symporter